MERIINEHLTNNRTVLVLAGPTASGKTQFSLELSKHLDLEIISADSRQIYKHINIGTAKASKEELAAVPHHFIDILELDEFYSAGVFEKEAEKKIDEIFERRRVPLISGGTGFYIKALLEGIFEDEETERDFSIRENLERVLKEKGKDALYSLLLEIDPESAIKYSDKNPRRLMRALEYYYTKKEKFSKVQKNVAKEKSFASIYFAVKTERDELYKRINERVIKMWENGLVQETEDILNMGHSAKMNSLQTVGYKETIAFLKNELTMEETISLIQRNTRRYAKRQMTWLRSIENIIWIEGTNDILNNLKQIVSRETLGNE